MPGLAGKEGIAMKTTKLINRIQKLLGRPSDQLPIHKLRKTIKALKRKQEALEERRKRTRRNGARRKLQRKIEMLREQRRRGAETYHRLIALHADDDNAAHAAEGSIIFLADQAAAAQLRADQRRLDEQAEQDDAEGDRLDGPPVGQIDRQ